MTTPLKSPLKRELVIDKAIYILTITPDGFKLVPKGKRKGYEMSWTSLVSGEAALAVALHASLGLSAADNPTRKTLAADKPPQQDIRRKQTDEQEIRRRKPSREIRRRQTGQQETRRRETEQ